MRILRLQLEQFRNYSAQDIVLPDGKVQLFLGPNGSGKTNLLEAVSVLSLGKSCRGRDDSEIVQWDRPFFRLIVEVESDAGERSRLEVVRELAPRRRAAAFHNDVQLPPAALVGTLPTVIFLPQELELFTGPPAGRRRFLDQLLSQADRAYVPAFAAYQQVLKQRSALLRQIADGRQQASALDPWDAEAAAKGAVLTAARLRLLSALDAPFARELRELGESWEGVSLRYERTSAGTSPGDIAEEMRTLLRERRERDIALLATTAGPHREDWQIHVGQRPLPSFASRGQERTAVVALLLLEVAYLRARRGERPVILFDDVFSELDDAHQQALLHRLTDCQVLMTAVRVPEEAEGATVWRMENEKWEMQNAG